MKKVLKVKLEPEVHDKFRTWAFNNRVTMQGELERHVGGLVTPEAPSAPRKQVKEASKVKEVVTVGGVVESETQVKPEMEKPKVDQKTCKHSYVADPEGGMRCFKCGYRTA